MKKFLISTLCLLATVAGVSAQELGLVTVRAENEKYEKSAYIKFCETTGQLIKVETKLVTVLKLPSLVTLGGYTVSVERTTDLVTNQSKKAVVLAPIGAAVAAVSSFLRKPGADTPLGYFIDDTEIDPLLKALAKMRELSQGKPTISTSWTYICYGGFAVSIGYNATLKTPLWLARVGMTGEMPSYGKDFDFIKLMTETFEEAKKALSELK